MIRIDGRLRIGTWQEAWYLSQATLLSSVPTKTEVRPVLAAPWKRTERTDWVWRFRDRDYPPNTFGGTCELTRGGAWGTQLFATEIEAWAYAVGHYRTRLRERQRALADEVERCAVELGEATIMLELARQRLAAAPS